MQHKLLLAGLFLCIFLSSCSEFKYTGERVTEGVTYQISTDLLFNPLVVQFVDPSTGAVPSGLQISVASSDFSGIYTLDGKLELQPVEGVLPLGVRKDELRGATKPLTIQLTYSAPGYPEQSQSFLVRDTLPRMMLLSMTKEVPQPGADNMRTTVQLGPSQPQELTSDQRAFAISWPQQARLLGESGQLQSGVATLRASYYRNTPDNRAFLRKQVTRQPFQLYDGREMTVNIEPLGLLAMDLENQSATDLLYPVTISINLPSSTSNRLTGRPLRDGDKVPVLAYIAEEGHWVMSGFAEMEKQGNQLRAHTRQQALRPLVFGWPSFQDPAIASECILLLEVAAEVPEPYTGVYRRDYLDTIQTSTGQDSAILIKEEVFYSYSQRPALGYSAIFPDCATGNAQGLDGFIREARDQIRDYFLRQDSLAFKGVSFVTDRTLFPVLRPEACLDQMPSADEESITLRIDARSETDGFLSYRYANIDVEEYVRLEKGINEIDLPLPDDVFLLNTEASFGFTFREGCASLSDGITTDLCALREGFSFDISPPFPKTEIPLALKGETACNNPNNTQAVLRPTVPVLVREHCPDSFSPFSYLGQLTDGEFKGQALISTGKSYDFLMPIGQSYTLYEDITLDTGQSYRRGNSIIIVTTAADGTLEVDLGIIDIPDAICDLLGL